LKLPVSLMAMFRTCILACLILFSALAFGQVTGDTVIRPEGYRQFFYPNGKVSSEGVIRDGKPDAYWKNYHENGVLKSEGNRVNFLLDGEWRFYDDTGTLRLSVNYLQGKKNGWRKTFTDEERIEEFFEDDVKQGLTLYFDNEGFITRSVPFENGREEGLAKTFNRDSLVIVLMEYRRGVAISREFINRFNKDNLPHGAWKTFYPSGILREDFAYKHGKLDGYYRKYDRDGNMESIVRYENGVLVRDSDEVYDLEIKRNYYPDMQVKIEGTYRDGIAHGIRKEFNPDGSLKVAYVMDMGRLLGFGILDAQGRKQGYWKEFYVEGPLKSEGNYKDAIKTGDWIMYFPNGIVEQKGNYNQNGREHGQWIWYYMDGTLRKEESFTNGLRNGEMVEYGDDGEIIAKGSFADDEEEGEWFYQENGYRQQGSFAIGERDGEWIHFFPDGVISFKGKFIDGYPDGKHLHYNPDGSLKSEGNYIVGTRHGTWKFYDETGNLIIVIDYRNGIETRYDYQLIRPELKGSDL
jgi:uncharacterized protein